MSRIRVEASYLAAVYQVAGHRLLAEDTLTDGQKARLTELILNTLSDPAHHNPQTITDLYHMAVQP